MWIDGESFAEKLKGEGLAKDYVGASTRPVWLFLVEVEMESFKFLFLKAKVPSNNR